MPVSYDSMLFLYKHPVEESCHNNRKIPGNNSRMTVTRPNVCFLFSHAHQSKTQCQTDTESMGILLTHTFHEELVLVKLSSCWTFVSLSPVFFHFYHKLVTICLDQSWKKVFRIKFLFLTHSRFIIKCVNISYNRFIRVLKFVMSSSLSKIPNIQMVVYSDAKQTTALKLK